MTIDFEGVAKWALSDKTGGSSKFMAAYLLGFSDGKRPYHPNDDDDFCRCLGLLNAVPSFRTRLSELSVVNAYWEALVNRWDDIETSLESNRYKLMRKILAPIEDNDSKCIRLGGGSTIRFK